MTEIPGKSILVRVFATSELSEVNCIKGDSLLAEVSHDEAKMRERGERVSPLSLIFASS